MNGVIRVGNVKEIKFWTHCVTSWSIFALNKIFVSTYRRWYISTRQEDQNRWVNLGDGTQMINLQDYFLNSNEWGESVGQDYKKDYLVYGYSLKEGR